MSNSKPARGSLAALALGLAVPFPVQASEAGDDVVQADAAEDQADSVIIVSARRRDEDVQDVPIALSVIDAAQVDLQGLFNINRLTQVQPTLQFYSTNPRNTFINIRGIGAPFGLTNDGFEQGVGIYIDQVHYNRIVFEIGLKTKFWDNKATLNLAAFWTDIQDFQASVVSNISGSNVLRGYLANADKVRSRGVEADFRVQPSDRFTAYVSGAFTDARFLRFVDAPCPPELAGGTTVTGTQVPGPATTPGALSPANCDVSGQWLPGVSRWAFSWGAEYNVPATVFGLEGNAYAGYVANYRSKFSSNASRSIYTDIDGYSLHSFRAGFRIDRYDFFVWIRNAFDEEYFESLAVTPGNTGLISAQMPDPRTAGLTVSARF
jgi:outer membrane receptor protein involved in Fe transport